MQLLLSLLLLLLSLLGQVQDNARVTYGTFQRLSPSIKLGGRLRVSLFYISKINTYRKNTPVKFDDL